MNNVSNDGWERCPNCGKRKNHDYEFCNNCRVEAKKKHRSNNRSGDLEYKHYCQYNGCLDKFKTYDIVKMIKCDRFFFCSEACRNKFFEERD
jgi:hypothetical protein